MSRWDRFWWEINHALYVGCGLRWRAAWRFARCRGEVSRQQKRAFERELGVL